MDVEFTRVADGHEILLDGTIVGFVARTPKGYTIESIVPNASWEMTVSTADLGGESLDAVAEWVKEHADDFDSLDDEEE